jgi:hypothetical protein
MERKCLIIFLENSKGMVKLKDKMSNIFILSDEEIKEGDWYIDSYNNICQYKDLSKIGIDKGEGKKIIATTDSSLSNCTKCGNKENYHNNTVIEILCNECGNFFNKLPQPSQSFLEVFVTEYNKGNQIKEVLVEYEIQHQYHTSKEFYIDADFVNCTKEQYDSIKEEIPTCPTRILERLKINPKDNTITIKKL